MHVMARVKTRVHYTSKVAPFSNLVTKQLRLSFTPSRPIRDSGGCSVSPSGLHTPGELPVGLRAVLDKLWWRHKCQCPCQIEPLWYALVPWPTRVWACCHTKEHTGLTWVARDNAVGIPTRLRPGQSWGRNSVGGGRDFLFFRTSGPALGLTRPPNQGAQGFFSSGKGAVACDEWSCTSAPPICLHGVDKDFKFLPFFLTWSDALWTSHSPTLVHFIPWWVDTNAAEKCASPVFNLTP